MYRLLKLAPIAADIAISVLLFMMLHRASGSLQLAFLGGLLHAFNPILVLVSAYHSQFDAILLLCILVALWMLPKTSFVASGWLLGLSILDKSWPVLILPSILLGCQELASLDLVHCSGDSDSAPWGGSVFPSF